MKADILALLSIPVRRCDMGRDKMSSKACIGEIKRLQEGAQSWFELLVKGCEHHVDGLCHIPVSVHEETGVIVCKLKNCPVV